jgi:hypothetical protein
MPEAFSQLQTSEHAAFAVHLYRSRREFRSACQRAGKSGKQIERCVISTFQVAEGMGFGAISVSGSICCASAIENCGSLFLTAEQCKSDRTLKERRKRTGKLVRLFFRETGFFRKNLTAMRNYGVVGDIPTQSGSELLPAIGRWSNPTNAISDALTLTQHQRKVTTRLSRGACHERFNTSSLRLLFGGSEPL